ncbi:MAG: FecR domain-containing protein [Acidobacteria bacterium]|nr:FecR domain-containing protein [Acidobacteriota bacterium]
MAVAADEPRRAGEVSALLPKALAERATGSKDLALQDPVFWNDLVKTLEAGRLRIILEDQSVLSVGARSTMRIVQHDAKTRQTLLELGFGRVRARVVKGLAPQANFEVMTRTAALGSVGTEFYVRGDEKESTVIGLDDKVRVRNRDTHIRGEEILSAGELTTVVAGQPPTPKRPATPQEMRQAMEETMPAQVARIEPFQAPAGSEPRVVISGAGIDHLPNLSHSDVPIVIEPGPCATLGYVTARLKLGKDTVPGIHEVTFDGPNGPIMAAFLVQPPGGIMPSMGRMIHAAQVPAGALHRGVVMDDARKPLAGARVRIRQDGKESVAETNASGMFEIQAEKPGTAELFLEGTDRQSSLEIVRGFDPLAEASRYTRVGDILNVPGVINAAKLGERSVAVATTQLKKGESFSTVEIPLDQTDGPAELALVDAAGNERKHPIFVYRILGGRIDNPALISGQKTQGEFVVCFGDALASGQRLNAFVTARGFIRFFGDGAKGQVLRKTISVTGQGTTRIPFQVEATKGAGPGVPFFINLSLSD